MRAIFLSYRRDDSEGEAGRLFDDLTDHFGQDAVFMDVAAIEAGRDFRKVIDQSVSTCGVLLAVIGKHWLDSKDETSQRRLDDPSDFVRLETASALKRDIPVIPVLVHGAKMPRIDQLPDDLKDLAYRNGVELTHARWNSDLQLLIKALRPHLRDGKISDPPPGGWKWKFLGLTIATVVLIGVAVTFVTRMIVADAEQKAAARRYAEEKELVDKARVEKEERERQALAEKAAADKATADKAAADKSLADKKALADQAAEEKAAADRLAADKAAAEEEKRRAEKAATDKAAADKAAAERIAAEKAAAEQKAAADKVAAEKAAAEKAAAEQGPWVGSWVSADPQTRSITRLSIDRRGQQIRIRAWGACHPTDCDWGFANATESGGSLVARWNPGFASEEMTIHARGSGLNVTVRTVFTDNSHRPTMIVMGDFVKAP